MQLGFNCLASHLCVGLTLSKCASQRRHLGRGFCGAQRLQADAHYNAAPNHAQFGAYISSFLLRCSGFLSWGLTLRK